MDDASSFGRWLKQRRKALDLTQDELAQRVGCALITIKKFEAGERRPSRQIAERLAECLAVAPEERAAFLQVARADLAVDQLEVATQLIEPSPTMSDPTAAPTGTVTFLFTDIEGSTQLWERDPQAMNDAVARHDALLRASVEAHRGSVFKIVGDNVDAVFARASDALAAALAAQRTLQAEPWGAIGSLRVRLALHTGIAQVYDGDYLGLPLNRVARLLAAGHGGQILLSLATAELVRDYLPPGLELRDLGLHRLKDLSRPEHIFQLCAPDLAVDFPPLQTLERHWHNLPAQPTALIGRKREVAAVCELLRRADVRFVTLTGPGGVGKTRLALDVAAEVLEDFASGISFVDLAPLSDSGLVIPTIAQTLDVREMSGQPLLERLQDYLRSRQLLLLLDNFEQVLEAAPQIADLLAACPKLKVLVTSREVLHLYGEHEFGVPPLALLYPKQLPIANMDRATSLAQYPAVQLFIERAKAVKSDFAITNANAPVVAEICERLDGLPLAIELGAARVRLFPPNVLLARLTTPLRLLTGGSRDRPARQQTLSNTIDWSYHLLDDREQRLFARLGVFVGGCTLEAAEAVCIADGDLSLEVVDGITSLLDKSLLYQVEGMNGEPRYKMLETIRRYASKRLMESGAATIRNRHLEFFLKWAEETEPKLKGAEQASWIERLDTENGNLRAALAWSLESGEAVTGLRLAVTLGQFWEMRGYLFSEGRDWLERVLARVEAREQTVVRAKAFRRLGILTYLQGDYAAARTSTEKSLALYQELGDKNGIAESLYRLGVIVALQHDDITARSLYAAARACFEESLDSLRELGDRWTLAYSLNFLGEIGRMEGDYLAAHACYEESLAIRRDLGDETGIALSVFNLGLVALNRGAADLASAFFVESLALFQKLGRKRGIVDCLVGLAGVVGRKGQPERAARLFGAAEALHETFGTHIDHSDRMEYDHNVAAVRAQLDETAFTLAWAEGRTMTLEQAITAALGDND